MISNDFILLMHLHDILHIVCHITVVAILSKNIYPLTVLLYVLQYYYDGYLYSYQILTGTIYIPLRLYSFRTCIR